MNEKLTLNWIVETLKKSGIGSKQIVIERLEKADWNELLDLQESTWKEAEERAPF